MSKLNDFFEKKKQKSKGLNELVGSRKPTIGGLKVNTNETTISSVISEGNIDDWSINTEVKETSDFFIVGKNLSSEGIRKPVNSQLVVAVKTSKPDFDSNIWKSKSNDSSINNSGFSSGKGNNEEVDNKGLEEIEKDKPKETLKYNVRARLAARGQKVGFLNTKDAINSMPTLAAAVANVNKPKMNNFVQSHSNSFNNDQNLIEKETSNCLLNQSKDKNENKNIISSQDKILNNENNQTSDKSDLDIIKQLRTCNVNYLNNNILFNCIIDIEQSKIKYSNIIKDF